MMKRFASANYPIISVSWVSMFSIVGMLHWSSTCLVDRRDASPALEFYFRFLSWWFLCFFKDGSIFWKNVLLISVPEISRWIIIDVFILLLLLLLNKVFKIIIVMLNCLKVIGDGVMTFQVHYSLVDSTMSLHWCTILA